MSNATRCFVPSLLVDIINNRVSCGKELMEPVSSFVSGVCLVVDISGFTKLSAEFCLLGKTGIDRLQLATNDYLRELVDIVYRFGGEIMKFAGDALICVFTNVDNLGKSSAWVNRTRSTIFHTDSKDSDDSVEVVHLTEDCNHPTSMTTPVDPTIISSATVFRALICAEKLRNVKNDKLTVHVGMSCGEMCFGILGGAANRWECLVSGSCIQEISSCLDDAPTREIAMTNGCKIAMQAGNYTRSRADGRVLIDLITPSGPCKCSLHPMPSGNFLVQSIDGNDFGIGAFSPTAAADVDERALPILQQFVPLPIADKLEAQAELHYLAEIREVTTMFMKVRISLCCSFFF